MIADAFAEHFNAYVDGVLNGEIVAGKLVRAACERHRRDILRQSTSEFPYHFSWQAAKRACLFYPRRCCLLAGSVDRVPFELEPWQLFCEASIFGWLRDADETRRFRTTYESVARKNGKSTRAAGRAIYMAGFDNNPIAAARAGVNYKPEPGAQVVLAAKTKEQIKMVVYDAVRKMRESSPDILSRSTDVRQQIEFYKNEGKIFCVASEKPLDGLNPSMVLMDEIHAWSEYQRQFHSTQVTGCGFRDQPIIGYITTAGTDASTIWLDIYNYASNVVSGLVDDDSYFAFIAEIDKEDDPLDPANWPKSNPNIGVSVKRTYLEEAAKRAASSHRQLQEFIQYHGNRMVSSADSAFDMKAWGECEGELSDWSKADAVVAGFDLGGMDDFCSVAFVARFETGEALENGDPKFRFEVQTQSYIANASKRDMTAQPFSEWCHYGYIQQVEHPKDELFKEICRRGFALGISEVVCDATWGGHTNEKLEQEGFIVASAPQNFRWFTPAIIGMQAAVSNREIRHTGNPLLTWCVNNAVTRRNLNDEIMYSKRDSKSKIDPVVAMTMAYHRCAGIPGRPQGSLYL